MYCTNCGSKMEDGDKFCVVCGAKVEETIQEPAAIQNPVDTVKKMIRTNKGSNRMKVAAAAIGALAVAVAGGIWFSGQNYKKPVDQLVRYVNHRNCDLGDLLDAVCPRFAVDAYRESVNLLEDVEEYTDIIDDFADEMDYIYDDLENSQGENAKASYEIRRKKELTRSQLNEIKRRYKELRDDLEYVQAGGSYYYLIADELTSSELKKYDKLTEDLEESLRDIEITKGYQLYATMSLGDEESEEELTVIKINGKWCIDVTDYNMSGMIPLL